MSVCFTMDIFVAWGPIISSTEHAQVQGRGGGKSQYRYCNTSRTESKSKLQFFSTILFPSRFLGPRSGPPCHQCAFGGLHTSETPPACHSTVYGVRGPSTTAAACTLHGICGLSLAAARTSHRIVQYHITSDSSINVIHWTAHVTNPTHLDTILLSHRLCSSTPLLSLFPAPCSCKCVS